MNKSEEKHKLYLAEPNEVYIIILSITLKITKNLDKKKDSAGCNENIEQYRKNVEVYI